MSEKWIRNKSDKIALEAGYYFDQARADHICDFFESQLVLYEGEFAGQPFKLMEWQKDYLSRAFGWVYYSDDWGRVVRRFRKCSLWVPKKSGKSPMAAGVGLYLLAADNEQGNKIFSVARDGKQSRIVHNHAVQMVKRSPWLNENCTINKTTGRITFHPTESYYDILSGDNIEGQEGLNGSSITDEKHVVPGKLAKVLEYMGASRAEGMDFGVSTAGNNPEGYGKQDYDYGKRVERGEIIDHNFLHCAYEVPADTPDEVCKLPETWKIANPSYGVTIRESEMASSCKRAQRSRSDWLTWKMYRLNQWQHSSNPWLTAEDWEKNKSDFTLDDFKGKPVWLGLDLSKTRDMSSIGMIFKEGDDDAEYFQHAFPFLPQQYAIDYSNKAPFLDWGESGHLEIIPGEVIRQENIRERLRWIDDNFEVQELWFDRKYAFDLIDAFCEDELGWDCVDFRQSTTQYAGPVANFEFLLASGKLRHNDNPVLNWQAGHVECKVNDRGDKIPAKPKRDDYRKIDCIVSLIMALNGAFYAPPVYSPGDFFESTDWIG